MRESRNVEILDLVRGHAFLDLIAGKEEPALKLIGGHSLDFADQNLLDVGEGQERLGAEDLLVGGHFAPTEQVETSLFQNFLGDGLGTGLGILILLGKIHDPDAEIGVTVEGLAPALDNGTEELVGDLGGDSGSVSGAGIRIQSPTVH